MFNVAWSPGVRKRWTTATCQMEFLPVYFGGTVPPSPPAYWNHGFRRKISTRSLILKDLQLKSLRTKDLAAILLSCCQRASQKGILADSMAAFGDGHTSGCSDQIAIIAHGGLGVCDGAHRWFVTKEISRVPHPSFFEGWDSAPTACDLSLTPAAPSTVECTDDPHRPPFSQSARKGWCTRPDPTKIKKYSPRDVYEKGKDVGRVPHPSFFEGWDSAPTACDLSLAPAAPSTVERTDDPHRPPFSQSARKGWGTRPGGFDPHSHHTRQSCIKPSCLSALVLQATLH